MRALGLATLIALAAAPSPARADGELTVRGMYYKEQATRVAQPMLDAAFDVGERGSGEAHFLVDAITSASANGSGGASFTERRYEAGAGYQHQLGLLRVGATARFSTEPDYRAIYGAVHGDVELFAKNLTLSATFGGGSDRVTNAGAPDLVQRITGHLTTALASLSASQLVSEHGVVGLSYDLIRLDGYQQNPYRTVTVGGAVLAEQHPDTRTRQAVGVSLKWFFPRFDATVIGQYRFYADSWDLHAHTPEVRVVKDVGDWITVGARYRYHRQDAASFYRETYPMADPAIAPYYSADDKLAAFDGHLLGGRLEVAGGALGLGGRLEAARGEAVVEYVVQNNRFGNALVSYVALVLPFEY